MSYGADTYTGPNVLSTLLFETRTKEQQHRLQWLFDKAAKKRREEGLPPTPQSKNTAETNKFIINRDWFEMWKEAHGQVMLIYYEEQKGNCLSCEGHFWLADLYFFHKCKFGCLSPIVSLRGGAIGQILTNYVMCTQTAKAKTISSKPSEIRSRRRTLATRIRLIRTHTSSTCPMFLRATQSDSPDPRDSILMVCLLTRLEKVGDKGDAADTLIVG